MSVLGIMALLGSIAATNTYSAIPLEDVSRFPDKFLYKDLLSIQSANLMSAELAPRTQPWSDDYWPTHMGRLAKRYADPDFPFSLSLKANSDYLFSTLFEKPVDILSPAEKYDLLVGDETATLTRSMLDPGDELDDGAIESWAGICHGWAAASMMLPRPRKLVNLRAADGKLIPFYPSDIKSLGSALWAAALYDYRMIGTFCQREYGDLDGNGRMLNPECFDLNPVTWHLAIVNQLGYAGRTMVMDVQYNREIWNQPVLGYRYQYFNPATGRITAQLAESAIPIQSYFNDRFRKYRNPQTSWVVGIVMDVTYLNETTPSHRKTDSEQEDLTDKVRYYYDLELSAEGAILGGEWHHERHPDVLWLPAKTARALSVADPSLPNLPWDGSTPFPVAWKIPATQASSYRQPLARIVELLFRISSE
ncbi:MAG: hypothetical protein A2428_13280 [Bdellovibrionales bacterium RIFOXYC1_FULL_54_43]|nr:MAG: hypothetical protein A2428_13280 [Bdellovibrionales bacterium RIFOXYC1_FULL_54_43]OFZ83486.1 MAG: hypothetical protein A2603_12265 [Bdellovibrionales bacterium RIFOXYD1_FULL_55_31]